jgi:hypothetical protein
MGFRGAGGRCTRHRRGGVFVSWLTCNALHGVPFVESAVYIDRLRVLQDSALRERFRTQIMHAMEG